MATGYEPRKVRARGSIPVVILPAPSPKPRLNVHYPLFFFGAVIISVFIFLYRKSEHLSSGVTVSPDAQSAVAPILNEASRINLQASGAYKPTPA